MKKSILSICLCLFMATYGNAACIGGWEITGNNGHVYCLSNVAVNWYTAFVWCEAQGRNLASIEQLCDIDETQKWDGETGSGKCPNLKGSLSSNSWIYSATPRSMDFVYGVTPNGSVDGYRPPLSVFHAGCW